MTENEAKTKWCPFARVTAGVGRKGNPLEDMWMITAINRTVDDKPSGACIASKCMAWRWYNVGNDGYCGLAGKTE